MTTTYEKGATPKCPHCESELDCKVEDMVVAGRVGLSSVSEEQCGDCDEYFTVMLSKEGKYLVEPIEPEEK